MLTKDYKTYIITVLVLFAVCTIARAETPAYREATVSKIEGTVVVKVSGSDQWDIAEKGMVLGQSDKIKTGKGSSATIIFDAQGLFDDKDKDCIDIEEDTELILAQLVVDKKTGDKTTLVDLSVGKIIASAAKLRTKDSKFEVKTPTSIVGVRGTNFVVEVRPGK